jgi:hypothetical protein
MKSATHPDFRLVTSDSEKETEEVAEETETKTKTKSNEKAKKPAASSIGIDQIRAWKTLYLQVATATPVASS